MLNSILQKVSQFSKSALTTVIHGSGTAALYLGASTFLAAILLTAYLSYTWGIDKEKWTKAYAVLRGDDMSDIEQAAQDRIADMSYDHVLEHRSQRLLDEEFHREVRQPVLSLPVPMKEPEPEPPPPAPSDSERIAAYEKRIQDDLARVGTAGRDELTRLIEDRRMDLEQAKEVIRKFWKDGFEDLVLRALLDMADRRRGDILYTFDHNDAEELKDLNEILKAINDGRPMTSVIENASQ